MTRLEEALKDWRTAMTERRKLDSVRAWWGSYQDEDVTVCFTKRTSGGGGGGGSGAFAPGPVAHGCREEVKAAIPARHCQMLLAEAQEACTQLLREAENTLRLLGLNASTLSNLRADFEAQETK